jgi:hypothetical protein
MVCGRGIVVAIRDLCNITRFAVVAAHRNLLGYCRLEFHYTASTCALMYNRQRPHLYYGCENLKYYLTPSPVDFLTRGAALRHNSIGPQPLHKGIRTGGQST